MNQNRERSESMPFNRCQRYQVSSDQLNKTLKTSKYLRKILQKTLGNERTFHAG